ncbi:cytoplasmic polyadenylation element-binding protein 4 isoform X1 [Electrophorus electricus]|uniref:cytoplasmic polyadenylation element-binding protein 4 isoform X1 n=1 Tax=Electrophorus electricus TaxID=8005 RepID=UPI0015D02A86|nr:cytoplasmic polyadenylation element-binding protein 4 isoform X1 [Electrophorus electricus]XP_026872887.2 cytoplasmic polyadenylation element-binding protein 4 isoform X1 [Electrophorus electricus]XP_026872888.2 cytoplasmic polyadenylation element-binding protein 4 isoform X1 [Electrophorus electricus]XP_026872889.2 cytoplasmic polyadenylation element-binding protein 4 isoform X1 [Electrophorus electricus]
MGDYSFGVLVKNNASNKSVFPVRIHPHLQHPVHQQTAPQSPPAFINSNTPSSGGNAGSAWLFPTVTTHSNMQDEILDPEKAKAQLQHQDNQEEQDKQPVSPQGHQEPAGIISDLENPAPEETQLEKGALENGGGKEGLRLDSPVLSGFDYQETAGIGPLVQSSSSSSSSLPGFSSWSSALPSNPSSMMEEVGFFSQAAATTTTNAPPPLLFQNFSHHNTPAFGGGFSHQVGPLSQHAPAPAPHPHFQHPHSQHQQHRRSPASPNPPPFNHRNAAFNQLPHLGNNLNKPPSPWGNYQSPGSTPTSSSWSPGGGYGGWGCSQGRGEYRRGLNGGVTPLNSISPLKKSFPNNQTPSQKYSRNNSSFNPKPWMEDNLNRNDGIFPFQERSRSFDGFSMHSLENSLIDIMRAEQDSLKGRFGFSHPGGDGSLSGNARNYGRRRGHSSLFPMEDERGFGEDERSEQGLGGLGSPHCFPHQNGERIERYSRKVFVGGLPPDIDEDEITASFRRFGHLFVDWPHKAESKSYFPPKGYAFLLFQEESSVQALIDACMEEDGKLYLCVSSPTIKDKPVQIRPWNLNDSDFVMDGSQPLDPRKTIFVGGVPRPLRAVELAMIMDRLYGGVCYAGIDTDPELKYPKGAGRVAFSNQQSYIAAISARFVQLQHGEIDKRVEVKPYVLDDQLCDECQGTRCAGKFAPFFCANVTCLQYYCEYCWAAIHSRAGREFHKPLVKEGGDRPRHISFRWN